MSDMEQVGLVNAGEVHKVVVGILDYMKKKKPDLIEMYAKGIRVMLTTKGLCLTDRQHIGDLKKYHETYTIVEVLTVEELYKFMGEFLCYVSGGQSSAVISIMEYKLKEKMDDIYEDNYNLLFKED